MRVTYAGTPAFAVPALESIVHAGHEVTLVLTQPDRPAGRGQQPRPSPVSQAAEKLGLRVAKPATLKTPEAQHLLESARAEVMVVAAYGLILPQAVLDIPPRGCLNIHASLLPRWRGAAPVHRAILAGDEATGIGIMRMEAGLDTGPVLLERRLPIGPDDTTGTLTEKLARLGAEPPGHWTGAFVIAAWGSGLPWAVVGAAAAAGHRLSAAGHVVLLAVVMAAVDAGRFPA